MDILKRRDEIVDELLEIQTKLGFVDTDLKLGSCSECIHNKQGEFNTYCTNPKQDNKNLKRYTYWNLGCRWAEKR